MPEKKDIERWTALGVSRDRINVTGSIKFDPDVQPESRTTVASISSAFSPDSLVLFGGSTHHGEEKILAEIFLRLRQEFPPLRLFIAPRHVERLPEIRAELAAFPLRIILASELLQGHRADADCILLDTTGELRWWYDIATVVFVGKSLTSRGGQNPVEPILASKSVVFGPHMENFATVAKTLVANGGAIQVTDSDSLRRAVAELLRDSDARKRLRQNALTALIEHQGATARTAALVHEL